MISVTQPATLDVGTDLTVGNDVTAGGDLTVAGNTQLSDLCNIDGELSVTVGSGKDTVALTSTGSNTGITIGVDTNLYRSGANVLKTDDKMIVVGELNPTGDINHDGTNVGFYSAAPVAQQTGVGVSAAAIHAALVNLGLITA